MLERWKAILWLYVLPWQCVCSSIEYPCLLHLRPHSARILCYTHTHKHTKRVFYNNFPTPTKYIINNKFANEEFIICCCCRLGFRGSKSSFFHKGCQIWYMLMKISLVLDSRFVRLGEWIFISCWLDCLLSHQPRSICILWCYDAGLELQAIWVSFICGTRHRYIDCCGRVSI